ncbi:MAG: hypothetical protein WCX74_02675 [Candidatus Paceibacterota bacterium]
MKRKYRILILILITTLVSSAYILFVLYTNKANSNQETNDNQKTEQNIKEPISSNSIAKEKEEQEHNESFSNKISNEEAKKLFNAKEIVSNNSPKLIEFWTEATCPGDGFDSDYYFDKIGLTPGNGYFLYSCIHGDNGSHGGCVDCRMVKIKLVDKELFENDSRIDAELNSFNNIKINNSFAFVQGYSIFYHGGSGFEYNIFYKGNKSYLSCNSIREDPLAVYDINFDGYDDIFCFDGNMNVAIYNPKNNKFDRDYTICDEAKINEQGNLSCKW